jgi:hypothetical protein
VSTRKKDFYDNAKSVAWFRAVQVVEKTEDWNPKYGSVKGSILVSFEAQNKTKGGCNITDIEKIGVTSKRDDLEQAGTYGEGFKVGALVATRKDYRVFAQVDCKRREFKLNGRYDPETLHSYNKRPITSPWDIFR